MNPLSSARYAACFLVLCLLPTVLPATAQPTETSFYASIGTFGGYGDLTRELLGEDLASTYESDPGLLVDLGVVIPLARECSLDVKVSLGTAQIERTRMVSLGDLVLLDRTEADLQSVSLEVGTKIFLRPDAPCFQPWISVAARTSYYRAENVHQPVLLPLAGNVSGVENEAQALGLGLAPPGTEDVTTLEPVLGTGFEWPLKRGLILNVDANYGLESGWRLTTGFRFGGSCCGSSEAPTCSQICEDSYNTCTRQCRRRGERFQETCREMCTQRSEACTGRCGGS
jgi:hypothetical protein